MATRQKPEDLKAALIDQVAGLARERLPAAKSQEGEAFIRRFYQNVPPDDVLGADPLELFGAAIALWRFAETHQKGEAKVRVYNPRFEEVGWHSTHTVIEVVNDDMPFLVDSVTGELNRQDLNVHLVIHPVIAARRDAKGHLLELLPPTKQADDARKESVIQVRVDERTSPDVLARIQASIVGVLKDVRAAVEDWRQMRGRVVDVIKAVEASPPPLPAEEVKEGIEFLRWLEADHFTFLGAREHLYEGKGDKAKMAVVAESGLGILRDSAYHVFEGLRNRGTLPDELRRLMEKPAMLVIAKGNRLATVHRSVPLDSIAVKKFDKDGNVVGQTQVVGLFTSVAYNQSPRDIPLLRRKINETIARSGFAPNSHSGKNLITILESLPRDELLQMGLDDLYEISVGILNLQERQRIALFVRKDDFQRFVSCLVFVPRDSYNTDLRLKFQAILEQVFNGTVTSFYTQLTESVLARLHVIVKTTPGAIPEIDIKSVEQRLVEAARSWRDRLRQALLEAKGEERGLELFHRFCDAFPAAYVERFPGQSVLPDLEHVDEVLKTGRLAMNLYSPLEAEPGELRFKIFNLGDPVPLSDVLPMLENMGLKVISEVPFEVKPGGTDKHVWIHDFAMRQRGAGEVDIAKVRQRFHDTFERVWSGEIEDDRFNRLVLGAGLAWREVVVLRAYAKYLKQTGFTFSQTYIEDALTENPGIAQLLVKLFEARFDIEARKDAVSEVAGLTVEIEHALDAVTNLDQDRILRRFVNLIRSTLRTNYYQSAAGGGPKAYVSFKLDSHKVEELPLPRPLVEIWVYSPRVEAVHLRGGKVARGGIRWSDRREDFRTEVLGLMKAQMVKNAVIVPVGSKGGFFVKRPATEGGRDAVMAEVVRCYQTMMRGMLDITDNFVAGKVKPPADVVRHDEDDPYLVVAADKGTATFSDIANGVSLEYGFWLGDGFASGGSAGYDHKKMAITARGAWESVKRHAREAGIDIANQPFIAIGIGDMAGDVFGNGMLRSDKMKLVGAFNHQHIFLDPDPDPAKSLAERQRLFNLPRSTWSDYDASLISKGGGVFERKAKSIKLSAETKTLLGLEREQATPNEVVQVLLRRQVDLIWFGGIGTFIKASAERHVEVGDRANDAVRVNADEVKATIIGEGANLGMTQQARIQYGRTGGRLNTDAIDNSAGVDCSDHEVNIKILLNEAVAAGDLTLKQRDKLLAEMTEEVGHLVLQDNIGQNLSISVTQAEGVDGLEDQARLIRALERSGLLDRALEGLPSEEAIAELMAQRQGLARPELAVLLAYSKMSLYNTLLASDQPDDKLLAVDLAAYFPHALRERFPAEIGRHRLSREIVATVIANSMVNRLGPTFVNSMQEKTGSGAPEIARAYLVARGAFGLDRLWQDLIELDPKVPSQIQLKLFREVNQLVERVTVWLLSHRSPPIAVEREIGSLQPAVAALGDALAKVLPEAERIELEARAAAAAGVGVVKDLAWRVAGLDWLAAAPDIVRLEGDVIEVARIYYAVGQRFGLDWLRHAASTLPAAGAWARQAISAVTDDLFGHQTALTRQVLGNGSKNSKSLDVWVDQHKPAVERADRLLSEIKAAPGVDLAMLAVASRRLQDLVHA
ncbi:MAG: NAD-glutamate dehydrogenase [Proteobacteria bacterium]|nr:NAD-glutamate dehydrogenase [Pseudomonadota bacterium]